MRLVGHILLAPKAKGSQYGSPAAAENNTAVHRCGDRLMSKYRDPPQRHAVPGLSEQASLMRQPELENMLILSTYVSHIHPRVPVTHRQVMFNLEGTGLSNYRTNYHHPIPLEQTNPVHFSIYF